MLQAGPTKWFEGRQAHPLRNRPALGLFLGIAYHRADRGVGAPRDLL